MTCLMNVFLFGSICLRPFIAFEIFQRQPIVTNVETINTSMNETIVDTMKKMPAIKLIEYAPKKMTLNFLKFLLCRFLASLCYFSTCIYLSKSNLPCELLE